MNQADQQRTLPTPRPRPITFRKRAVAALLGSFAVAALVSGASALSGAGQADTATQFTGSADMVQTLIRAGLYVLLP